MSYNNNQNRNNFQPGRDRNSNTYNQGSENRGPDVRAASSRYPASPTVAHAPYNFVPIPAKVVAAETLPDHDCYDSTRHSGYFDVILTTETPLYIRGMLTETKLKEAASDTKNKKETSDFFQYGGKPVIPGSSLRGMLRNLVEIVAFGKIQPVNNKPKIFYRAVAADKDDPLGQDYKEMVGAKVRAGYLRKEADKLYVLPATTRDGKSFAKVRDLDKFGGIARETPHLPNLIHLNNPDYRVQYYDVVVTSDNPDRSGLRCTVRATNPGEKLGGVLVCTGNMAESSSANTSGVVSTKRRNFTVVFEPDARARPIQIAPQAVKDYLEGLTPFQKEAPFDDENGCLVESCPIFYIEPDTRANGMIRYFGHTSFFRVPAILSLTDGKRAVTPKDLVPATVGGNPNYYDLAEAMFGYVDKGKGDKNVKQDDKSKAYASRVSISDAHVNEGQSDFYEKEFTPKVLSSPKPITFQHYLEQPAGKDTLKRELLHYGDKTQIRGHKLYWRQQDVRVADVEESKNVPSGDSQHIRMRPVKSGTSFSFRVHFDNLSDVELGALEWVLTLPGSAKYRHQLGMGKPYGMGVVKLSVELSLIDRTQRYKTLFSADNWEEAVNTKLPSSYIEKFEQHICQEIGYNGVFENVPRIKQFLILLEQHTKDSSKFSYMQIEGPNEYKERPVLPYPGEVINPQEKVEPFLRGNGGGLRSFNQATPTPGNSSPRQPGQSTSNLPTPKPATPPVQLSSE